jgi:hypothetical protein
MSRNFLLFIIFFRNGCRKCHLTGNDTNSPLNGLLPKSNYLPEHCFPRRSGSAFLTPPASGYPDSEFTQFVNSSRLNGTQTARTVSLRTDVSNIVLRNVPSAGYSWRYDMGGPQKCSMSRSGEGLIANIVSNKVLPAVMFMNK